MKILKCTYCGGELQVNEDMSVGVYKYCDSTIIIPKQLDRKGQLYNRAVFLRQNNQFDKAMLVYEEILKEDNTDAEAHWGLVLSKYGIEYVTDPLTKAYLPTCHRTQEESILTDSDYKAAIEYSDFEAKRIIELEGKRISDIQQKILSISRNEPEYDVFICYKESDDMTGTRTEDSVLAQELYYELEKKNYKVFFARKTLENKLGSEYEPIIYAALNSAKVMIVLGTKQEHFEAVWVKNEWSRFLRMKKGQEKTLIPAYRGITAYDLPIELSGFQAQDMSKIGFMQDLTDGIEKCMRGSVAKKTAEIQHELNVGNGMSLERLLKNAETYMMLNDFATAESTYKKITEDYPEDYRGWWGMIVSGTNNLSVKTWFAKGKKDLSLYYSYIKKLANAKEQKEVEEKYLGFLKECSVVQSDEEIQIVNRMIAQYDSEIEAEKKKISDLDMNMKQRQSAYQDIEKNTQKNIREREAMISDFRKYNQKKRKAWIYLAGGSFLGFMSVILPRTFLFDYVFGTIAFGLIIIGIASFISVFNMKVSKSEVEIDKDIKLLKERNYAEEQRLENDLAKSNKEIVLHQDTISKIQTRIDECSKYLAYGRDVITDIFMAFSCRKIGIENDYNHDAVELRNRIFNNKK